MKTLAQALAGQSFTITADLSVDDDAPAEAILHQAKQLAPHVDGVQVTSHPRHQAQLSPLALAALMIREGIDPVTRLDCRDRNRLALQSDLVGLKVLGVTSLIIDRGDRPPSPGATSSKPVFDINCRELIAMASDISEESMGGPGSEFMVGTQAEVFVPEPDWHAEELSQRARAGARFMQTQPCFDMPLLRRYLQRLIDLKLTWKFAVVVTLAPLPGLDRFGLPLKNAPESRLPETVMQELDSATDAEQAGIEVCARLMREAATIPGVCGVNLLTLGNPAAVIAAIKASGLRAAD